MKRVLTILLLLMAGLSLAGCATCLTSWLVPNHGELWYYCTAAEVPTLERLWSITIADDSIAFVYQRDESLVNQLAFLAVGRRVDAERGIHWRGYAENQSLFQSMQYDSPLTQSVFRSDHEVRGELGHAAYLIRDMSEANQEQWVYDRAVKIWAVRLPLWSAITVLAVLPSSVARIHWRRIFGKKQIKQGFCGGCGYDLCASPRRCPECGLTVPSRT